MNNNKNKKKNFKFLFIQSIIMIFIGLIYISGTLAQWPQYNNTDWFSQSFYSPFSLSSISDYGGFPNNGFYSSYMNSFSSGLYSYPALANGTFGIGTYNLPYNNSNPFGLYSSRGPWPSGGLTNLGGYGYPWSNASFTLPTYSLPSLYPSSWMGGGFFPGGYGLFNLYATYPGNYRPISPPRSHCDPESAPGKMTGEWTSQQLKDEENNALTGELTILRENDSGTVKMLNSSLTLGEDDLTEFEYTRTAGEAPISFQGSFFSGYTAYFTGTANNKLCCRNHFCFYAGVFEVEGDYKIKDKLAQIVDKGTFTIKGPVSSSKPKPKPVEAIHDLGNPIDEGKKIRSLTTGAAGRIYGGTDIGCYNVGHMFVYDPATEETTDLGNPGYECNAMTTGTDGLIYLGGGTKSSGDHNCKSIGYANFAIYDPGKSWNPGQGSNANPRNLGQAVHFSGDEPDDATIVVHDLATAPDGKIYGCTGWRDGQSGEYYAHLFVYNPQTDTIEDLGQPISNQSSITRLTIASSGLIYGVILGPRTGYRPPPGKLFSYEPVSASYTLINTPASIEGVVDLTAGTDGLLYLAGGEISTIFTYNPISESFDVKGTLGGCGQVLRMICTAEGIIYIGCAVNGYFVRYDPERAWQDRPYSDSNDKPGVNPRVFHWTGKVSVLTEGQDDTIYFGNLSGKLFSFAGEE